MVPFFISEDGLNTRNHTSYRIKLDDLDSSENAERFINCAVYLPKELFNDEESMSLNMLEGFMVVDEKHGELGKIERIDDFSGNIVFTIIVNSCEVMIPLVEEQVIDIDYEKGIIELQLPDGLLDVYLED